MQTPVQRRNPATEENSGGLGVEYISFSEPCPHCATKKRHCLHGSCGQRKKRRLTVPAVQCSPGSALHRSFSLPVWATSPPDKNQTILRSQSDLVTMGQILVAELKGNELKDAKSDPVTPHVVTAPTATPPSDVGSKKESTPTRSTGLRMVECSESLQTEATRKRMLRRVVFPSRTRRRLVMQEPAKTEKNEETQRTNLCLKEDENGENHTAIPIPQDEDGDHSPSAASEPAISDDTDGDQEPKFLREIEARLDRMEKNFKELIVVRQGANTPLASRRPPCQHTPATAAARRPSPSAVASAVHTSTWEAMFEENDQEEMKPCYLVCFCNRCGFPNKEAEGAPALSDACSVLSNYSIPATS